MTAPIPTLCDWCDEKINDYKYACQRDPYDFCKPEYICERCHESGWERDQEKLMEG